MGWKEITKDEFFSTVGQMDVHPWPVGDWPYTSLWKTRSGTIAGKSILYYPNGKESGMPATRYMVPA